MSLKLFFEAILLHKIAVAGSVLADCIRSLTLLPKNIAAKWRGNVLIQALVRNTSKNLVFGLCTTHISNATSVCDHSQTYFLQGDTRDDVKLAAIESFPFYLLYVGPSANHMVSGVIQ